MAMPDRKELEALVSLLDDDDLVVSRCVDERLRSFGPDVVPALLEARAFDKARSLNAGFRLEEFSRLVSRGRDSISLFESSFLICSIIDCTLSRSRYEDLFFRCTAEYQREASDARTAFENIGVFNHIFYERLGFTLYDMVLGKKDYALVSSALESRKCNPVVLTFIYIMIAGTCGLPLMPLLFPGGVVPVYMENGKELFYINVFRKGEIFYRHNLGDSLKFIGGMLGNVEFKVRDEAALLTIYLESLQIVFSRCGDSRLCSVLDSALSLLGPDRYLTIEAEE